MAVYYVWTAIGVSRILHWTKTAIWAVRFPVRPKFVSLLISWGGGTQRQRLKLQIQAKTRHWTFAMTCREQSIPCLAQSTSLFSDWNTFHSAAAITAVAATATAPMNDDIWKKKMSCAPFTTPKHRTRLIISKQNLPNDLSEIMLQRIQ